MDSYVIINESRFELPKVISWLVCSSQNSIFYTLGLFLLTSAIRLCFGKVCEFLKVNLLDFCLHVVFLITIVDEFNGVFHCQLSIWNLIYNYNMCVRASVRRDSSAF